MRVDLAPHADAPSAAVSGVSVELARGRDARAQTSVLVLRYLVELTHAGLVLPAPAASRRVDDLWRRTCFEAFVRADGEAYYEFNFSPSTEWAAYRFSGYRSGMAPLEVPAPRIMSFAAEPSRYELRAAVDLGAVELRVAPWRLGLSAVLEEADGAKSYWALAHPPGKPDFHHADSFAIELPAPERA